MSPANDCSLIGAGKNGRISGERFLTITLIFIKVCLSDRFSNRVPIRDIPAATIKKWVKDDEADAASVKIVKR